MKSKEYKYIPGSLCPDEVWMVFKRICDQVIIEWGKVCEWLYYENVKKIKQNDTRNNHKKRKNLNDLKTYVIRLK